MSDIRPEIDTLIGRRATVDFAGERVTLRVVGVDITGGPTKYRVELAEDAACTRWMTVSVDEQQLLDALSTGRLGAVA